SCSSMCAAAIRRTYRIEVARSLPFGHVTPKLPPPADRKRPVGGSFTFGGRKGRMSATRQRALDELVPLYLVELPIESEVPLIVEIGCGKGDATAAMAGDEKDHLVLACEVNDATIANLAALLDAGNVENVGLWVGDAFELLLALGPSRVSEVRAWFPDPWPKPRH